jgi:hypothetical protein
VHRSETRLLTRCSDCGAELRPEVDRAFAFGTHGVLCFECAVARGGHYDETHDRWVTEPRIDDLGPELD